MRVVRLIIQQPILLTTKFTTMKKSIFPAAALLVAALISGHLYAQDSKGRTDLAVTQPANANASAAASDASSANMAASLVSTRAIKDFKSRFTTVADEQWSRMEKGFCATFTKDGFKTRAYYNAKGRWEASLKYCDETQLPHFARDVVKRTYYDLTITFVAIVEVPDHIAYLVHLEDKKTLLIVRVNEDGEMDVLNDYIKAN
jgi:hypothetical protein